MRIVTINEKKNEPQIKLKGGREINVTVNRNEQNWRSMTTSRAKRTSQRKSRREEAKEKIP